ncbi:hypothetical protein RM572_27910 [Streptomyces sp. DSM 42041]|uniref:Uncharacterized protein n=1 Tax=Streptomyces hazeniae TaxID=3075538 RepID=A0ABU2P025_9ACTN|nr:hypothetical protein [Streptomyces sp. DSM 42041]MDT0382584.1 hypothetical protein [Streptomyces sp. DSM 42041]
MSPCTPRPAPPTAVEADTWAEVLVRCRHLSAVLPVPTGQWLVQHAPGEPVDVLAGPADVVELAAAIQHRIRASGTAGR